MSGKISLPPRLIDQIKNGKAILFLGAGASYGCRSRDGAKEALMGNQLALALSNEFLGGERATEPLARVADYSVASSSLLDVQKFVKDIYEPICPLDFHKVIARFKWKAIVTTNYDRVIEKAYEQTSDRLQHPLPVIRDGDMRSLEDMPDGVPIIKIHGCVSRYSDTDVPMVLANEQYAKYLRGRGRLAINFREMAKDYPVIFCGYEMSDAHISQILFSLEDGFQDRPQYAAVNPRFDSHDQRHWSKHRMDVFTATFKDFIDAVDSSIPVKDRVLGSALSNTSISISRWLKVGNSPSHGLRSMLETRLLHVHQDMPVEGPNPSRFYRGDSDSWAPIKHKLDFPRDVSYQVLADTSVTSKGAKFVLIKGHAGSGKSVILRRIAWELNGSSGNALCFFCDGSLNGVRDVLQELHDITGERIFIVVDNALFDRNGLNECYSHAKRLDLPVTFIAGARSNEWNTAQSIAKVITSEEYSVGDLSQNEAELLCVLLDENNCLGALKNFPPDERANVLMGDHERQLLVTLHEATMGEGIEKILKDEYRNISPPEAQVLYLDICSLHRLGAPVRAGLISRISGTNFEHFRERLFLPLEKVVVTSSDWRSRDFVYRSRHTEISQIVFDSVLPDPEDKANQIARVVSALNTDYSSDYDAASKLLKGRRMAEEFANRALADRIFDAAEQSGIDRPFVLQQRALFELEHKGGSPLRAKKFIEDAIAEARSNTGTLHHTKAVVFRDLARMRDVDPSLADRYRESALAELKDYGLVKSSNYGVVTYCQVLLEQLSARLDAPAMGGTSRLSEEAAIRKLGELERNLAEGLQRWPNDSYLIGVKTELFVLLNKHPQAIAMLRAAFLHAPANEFVALRLSQQLLESGDKDQAAEALEVLRRAVSLNAAAKSINYQLARLLIEEDEAEHSQEISKLLRRSYADGDSHFDAQFWSARHEFLYGDRQKALAIYARFNEVPVPYIDVDERRGIVKAKDGTTLEYEGVTKALKGDFGFVECNELHASIFLHRSQLRGRSWGELKPSDRLKFKVAFTFRGPCGVDAH
jgi:hypothetical protein